jgi:hypothetical protein
MKINNDRQSGKLPQVGRLCLERAAKLEAQALREHDPKKMWRLMQAAKSYRALAKSKYVKGNVP